MVSVPVDDAQLQEWLNPAYLTEDRLQDLKDTFQQAEPYQHIAISDFLKEEKVEQILRALDEEQFFEKASDLFKLMQSNDLKGSQSEVLHAFRDLLRSEAFIQFMEYITGVTLQAGEVDVAGSVYRDTDYLLCHDDQLDQRQIAFMLYLSDLGEEDGGALNLFASEHGRPTDIVKSLKPQKNTFVCFQVREDSFHEVAEVTAKTLRIALNGWFHAAES